jgi:WD40 repeat protein
MPYGTAVVWEVGAKKELFRLPIGKASESPLPPGVSIDESTTGFAIAWSPDGRRLATIGFDKNFKIWDATAGTEMYTLGGHAYLIRALAWSPDGKRLATAGSDGAVKVWDLATKKETLTLLGHAGPAISVAWSPDGERIVAGGFQDHRMQDRETIRVWDTASGHEVLSLPGRLAAWSPDGRRLLIATRNGITVYDPMPTKGEK